MEYHRLNTVRNAELPPNHVEACHCQQTSLACRLLAVRFGWTISTATTFAGAAGLPQVEEA